MHQLVANAHKTKSIKNRQYFGLGNSGDPETTAVLTKEIHTT